MPLSKFVIIIILQYLSLCRLLHADTDLRFMTVAQELNPDQGEEEEEDH